MIRFMLLAAALNLVAGCATQNAKEPQTEYQIGLDGSRQARTAAEKAYAGASPQLGKGADPDSLPRVLKSRFPAYPQDLQRAGVEGKVVVAFFVEADGSIGEPRVLGTPPPQLAALALEAIAQWKFAPAMKDGVPVRTRLSQPFLFKIE